METDAALKTITMQTVLGAIAAGLFLLAVLTMRWWWLDGRRHRNAQKLLHAAHEDLSLHQQILATVAASTSEGICAINNKGVVLYANPACAAMLELPEKEIIGKELYGLLRTSKIRVHQDADISLLHGKQVEPFTDTWAQTQSQKQQQYTEHKVPLSGQEGIACGVITIFTPLA